MLYVAVYLAVADPAAQVRLILLLYSSASY
jgi:hypothetical protein